MVSKQEVKDCIKGKPNSKIPLYYWFVDEQFIKKYPEDVKEMKKEYENDILTSFYIPEAQAEEFLINPLYIKRINNKTILKPNEFTDEWGCIFATAKGGVGSNPSRPIIRNLAEWKDYLNNFIPLIDREGGIKYLRNFIMNNPDKYIIADLWRTFYTRIAFLIGMEELFIEIASGGKLFQEMIPVCRDISIELIKVVGEAGVDGVLLDDDWGTQDRLLISPESWRKYFKPGYKEMIDTAHNMGMEVFLHSCGNITELIPEWIDLKLDVLGHLQPFALNLKEIAEKFNGHISFMGGIDIQFNLIKGIPESIREEVRSLIKMFNAFEGRYICSPSNTIMPETPVENVQALFKAMKELSNIENVG